MKGALKALLLTWILAVALLQGGTVAILSDPTLEVLNFGCHMIHSHDCPAVITSRIQHWMPVSQACVRATIRGGYESINIRCSGGTGSGTYAGHSKARPIAWMTLLLVPIPIAFGCFFIRELRGGFQMGICDDPYCYCGDLSLHLL
jgi:hypothetical protein